MDAPDFTYLANTISGAASGTKKWFLNTVDKLNVSNPFAGQDIENASVSVAKDLPERFSRLTISSLNTVLNHATGAPEVRSAVEPEVRIDVLERSARDSESIDIAAGHDLLMTQDPLMAVPPNSPTTSPQDSDESDYDSSVEFEDVSPQYIYPPPTSACLASPHPRPRIGSWQPAVSEMVSMINNIAVSSQPSRHPPDLNSFTAHFQKAEIQFRVPESQPMSLSRGYENDTFGKRSEFPFPASREPVKRAVAFWFGWDDDALPITQNEWIPLKAYERGFGSIRKNVPKRMAYHLGEVRRVSRYHLSCRSPTGSSTSSRKRSWEQMRRLRVTDKVLPTRRLMKTRMRTCNSAGGLTRKELQEREEEERGKEVFWAPRPREEKNRAPVKRWHAVRFVRHFESDDESSDDESTSDVNSAAPLWFSSLNSNIHQDAWWSSHLVTVSKYTAFSSTLSQMLHDPWGTGTSTSTEPGVDPELQVVMGEFWSNADESNHKDCDEKEEARVDPSIQAMLDTLRVWGKVSESNHSQDHDANPTPLPPTIPNSDDVDWDSLFRDIDNPIYTAREETISAHPLFPTKREQNQTEADDGYDANESHAQERGSGQELAFLEEEGDSDFESLGLDEGSEEEDKEYEFVDVRDLAEAYENGEYSGEGKEMEDKMEEGGGKGGRWMGWVW